MKNRIFHSELEDNNDKLDFQTRLNKINQSDVQEYLGSSNQGMVRKLLQREKKYQEIKQSLLKVRNKTGMMEKFMEKTERFIEDTSKRFTEFRLFFETAEKNTLQLLDELIILKDEIKEAPDASVVISEDFYDEEDEESFIPIQVDNKEINNSYSEELDEQIKKNRQKSKSYQKFLQEKKLKNYRQGKGFLFHSNGHERRRNLEEYTKKEYNQGKWNSREKSLYAQFIDENREMVDSWQLRRMEKIYISLSQFIGTRNPQQCRSYHRQVYGDQRKCKVSENWKNEYQNSEVKQYQI